jgi:hypothetical protein
MSGSASATALARRDPATAGASAPCVTRRVARAAVSTSIAPARAAATMRPTGADRCELVIPSQYRMGRLGATPPSSPSVLKLRHYRPTSPLRSRRMLSAAKRRRVSEAGLVSPHPCLPQQQSFQQLREAIGERNPCQVPLRLRFARCFQTARRE